MTDEERAREFVAYLEELEMYQVDRQAVANKFYAALAAVREEVQREACDNLMIAIVPYLGRDQRVTKAAEQLAEYFEKHIRTGPSRPSEGEG